MTWEVLPYNTKIKAPVKPIPIPNDFLAVSFSFKKKADNNKTIIGVRVTITPPGF